ADLVHPIGGVTGPVASRVPLARGRRLFVSAAVRLIAAKVAEDGGGGADRRVPLRVRDGLAPGVVKLKPDELRVGVALVRRTVPVALAAVIGATRGDDVADAVIPDDDVTERSREVGPPMDAR